MIDGLKAYVEYRDSGVPWLERVPMHWQIARSKRLFSARKDLARPNDPQLSATQAYGVIEQAEFERRSGHRVVKISMHLDKRKHVEKDDFVISMRSFQGGIERAWASGAIRSSYVVLKPGLDVDANFFRYVLKSTGYIRALQATGDFIRDGQDLNFANFVRVDLPLVPLAEQAAIARFLDWANGRIERAIRAKRKVIALLMEQKQAIVQRGVSCGFDEGVTLKSSQVPWLGDIPSGWQVSRLKHCVTSIEQGWSPQCDAQPAGDHEWGVLKVGCVNKETFGWRQNKKLPDSLHPDASLEVRDGDILVSRANTRDLLGLAALADKPRPKLILSDKLFRFRAKGKRFDSAFLVLTLRVKASRAQIESSTNGASSSMQNIGQAVLKNLWLAVPPVVEQQAIVEQVAIQVRPLNEAILRFEREIELLREYRTRLVADVVTGKLDVRDAAARLPEDVTASIKAEPTDEADDLELIADEATEA